jgi:hypothetical protein
VPGDSGGPPSTFPEKQFSAGSPNENEAGDGRGCREPLGWGEVSSSNWDEADQRDLTAPLVAHGLDFFRDTQASRFSGMVISAPIELSKSLARQPM